MRDKIVIDTMNYYPERDGHIAALDEESTTTSQMVQAHLPDSAVVKGFNNIYFKHLAALARPRGAEDRSALAIAGDDEAAKQRVTDLVDELGYDVHGLGALAEGRRTQRDTAGYALLYAADPDDWSAGPRSVSASQVAEHTAQSRRYREM